MKKLALAAAAVSMALASTQANAAAADVIFNAELTATCTINVDNGGVLAPNADFTQLASSNGGGVAGQATVTTNMPGFNASVADVTGWDSSPAATATTSFIETMTVAATPYASGALAALPIGDTTVSVDLAANAATGFFGPGTYQATVVLTCE